MGSITAQELDLCKITVENQVKAWIDAHAEEEQDRYLTIEAQLKELTKKIDLIMSLFEQSKGALRMIKWVAYSVAAGWAAIVWAKDHLRV